MLGMGREGTSGGKVCQVTVEEPFRHLACDVKEAEQASCPVSEHGTLKGLPPQPSIAPPESLHPPLRKNKGLEAPQLLEMPEPLSPQVSQPQGNSTQGETTSNRDQRSRVNSEEKKTV